MSFRLIFMTVALIICRYEQQLEVESMELPADLQTLCPYTTFCHQNASQSIWYPDNSISGNLQPCCKPCSCAPDCGLSRTCCTRELDKYNLDKNLETTCISTDTASFTPNRAFFHFIDKCLNRQDSCRTKYASALGYFSPVYSRSNGMLYFNEYCASCHNQTIYIRFIPTLHCESLGPYIFFDFFDHLSRENTHCNVKFIVPNEIDLSNQICYPNFDRRECHSTDNEVLRQKCSSFNATYRSGQSVYRNVYCFLCISKIPEQLVDELPENYVICEGDRNGKFDVESTFLVFLDNNTTEDFESYLRDDKKTGKLVCFGSGSPLAMTCRPIKCPEGQFTMNGKCKYFGTSWYAQRILVWVNLTLADNSKILTIQDLKRLSDDQLASPKKEFISRPFLQNWNMDLFYSSDENGTIVRFLVAKLKIKYQLFNPDLFLPKINMSVNEIWTLDSNGIYFNFTASFSKYATYFESFESSERYSPNDDTQNSSFTIHKLSEFTTTPMSRPDYFFLHISKLHFCSQVELPLDEFVFEGIGSIFIKHNKRLLGSGEFKQVRPLSDLIGVRVCITDLNTVNNGYNGYNDFVFDYIVIIYVLLF